MRRFNGVPDTSLPSLLEGVRMAVQRGNLAGTTAVHAGEDGRTGMNPADTPKPPCSNNLFTFIHRCP
jgi:hypothetical protein